MIETKGKIKFGTTDFLMILVVVFWAFNLSFMKIVFREMPPLGFNGIRMILASVFLIAILRLRGEGFKLQRGDIWKLAALGVCGNTIFQLLFIPGLNLTTASNSSIIIAMAPAVIALMSLSLKQEKLHALEWAGIVLSFAGFYLVISRQFGGMQFSRHSFWGDLLVFSGNVFWALYTVLSKPILERISPLKFSTLTLTFGTAFYVPFCVKDILAVNFPAVSLRAWLILGYSAVFSLAIPYIVWYASVKRIGNSKTAIYDNLFPVMTVIIAYLLLGEKLAPAQAFGGAIILAGVFLTRKGFPWRFKPERKRFPA